MLGAIAGDIIGSVYEFHPIRMEANWDEFPLFTEDSCFTDDSVMTLAVAEALRSWDGQGGLNNAFVDAMQKYGKKYPKAGYGGRFAKWLMFSQREPYNSYGNGSAMRASPAGWFAKSLEEAENLAYASAAVTHNHPEGIKGAQAVAGCIYLARIGKGRDEIRDYVASRYNYDLSGNTAQIRQTYRFDESCQGTVPQAIIAFLESGDWEEAARKAVWLRGDADTLGAITGSIAEAYYGEVPEAIAYEALMRLDEDLRKSYLASKEWQEKNFS